MQTDKTLPKVMDVKVMHVVKQESKTTSPKPIIIVTENH